MIVTLDGPAGAGKSTAARALAARLASGTSSTKCGAVNRVRSVTIDWR